jgi:hypothetical protein
MPGQPGQLPRLQITPITRNAHDATCYAPADSNTEKSPSTYWLGQARRARPDQAAPALHPLDCPPPGTRTPAKDPAALALTPNVLDVGAAVESAISASALILDRCGRMTGHDPTARVQQAQQRRAEIDALMKRATTSAWAQVPAEPHRSQSSRPRE